jgi:hypothetical protein
MLWIKGVSVDVAAYDSALLLPHLCPRLLRMMHVTKRLEVRAVVVVRIAVDVIHVSGWLYLVKLIKADSAQWFLPEYRGTQFLPACGIQWDNSILRAVQRMLLTLRRLM